MGRRYRSRMPKFPGSSKSIYTMVSLMIGLAFLQAALEILQKFFGEVVLLLAIGSVVYLFYRRQKMIRRLAVRKLALLTPRAFEHYWGDFFRVQGYKATVTPESGDQGADVIIEKDGIKTAIQAKKYKGAVGNSAVQEVVASKAYYGCQRAMVITIGKYTSAAKELARVNGVELWDKHRVEAELSKLSVCVENQCDLEEQI